MNNQRIYAMFGRLAESQDELVSFHAQTMGLLQKLRSGEVLPSQLLLTDQGWDLAPVAAQDTLPMSMPDSAQL